MTQSTLRLIMFLVFVGLIIGGMIVFSKCHRRLHLVFGFA